MVKGMAERKWIDSILLPRRRREDFNDEYDSISLKVAKRLLIDNNYKVYSFDKVWLALAGLPVLEDSLNGLFGKKLSNMIKYKEALKELSKEVGIEFFRDYAYFGIGPDLVAKIDNEIMLIDVIVKQAKPKKYSKESYKIARKHGFKAMALMLDVEFKVGEVNLSEI
jgi:hypothetical protein